MRAYLAIAPAWFAAALQSLFFAAWLGGWSVVVDHTSWQRSLISSAVIAPFFGLLMWLASRRERATTTATLAAMTTDQRHEALKAARTGTPPGDPAARRAAFVLLRHRLINFERHQTLTLVMLGVFLALSALFAATGETWYLAGTAVFGWALIGALRYPRQSARKLAALDVTAPPLVGVDGKSRLR